MKSYVEKFNKPEKTPGVGAFNPDDKPDIIDNKPPKYSFFKQKRLSNIEEMVIKKSNIPGVG